MNEFNIEYDVKPNPKPLAYKRIIWLGTRKDRPYVNNFLNANSKTTVKEEINSVSTFPCLLVWNLPTGEPQYAEVTRTNKRTEKAN